MADSGKKTTKVFVEATKVLVIFVAFYLLQSQIFHVRYDIYGTTSGLARAHARTSVELDQTQEFVRLAIEDSTLELSRAREELEKTVLELQREREQLLHFVEDRSRHIESEMVSRLETRHRDLTTVSGVAEANALQIKDLRASVTKDPGRMKRSMIFPTVQLRGNGTVGSGVLVYSEPQSGVSESPVYTSFAITACHVVQEVIGREPAAGRVVREVRAKRQSDTDEPVTLSAKLVLFDVDRDVALLRLNSTEEFPYLADFMPLSEVDELDVFSPAYAVGCPLGNQPMPTLGEISSKDKMVGDQAFWMLNAPTFFGNSGGGIYQAPGYRLIGVSSMIYTYGKSYPTVVPHMGLFVPLRTICQWLTRNSFDFVLERRPIPLHQHRALVYLEGGETFPIPASGVDTPGRDDPGAPEAEDGAATDSS